MHESLSNDAVIYDMPTESIIEALCNDNKELQTENAELKAKLKEITDQPGYATLAWDVETTKAKREENWKQS